MPQLPSGLHFALDPRPIDKVIEDAYRSAFVHVLMAIKGPEDLFRHVDVLYFRPTSPEGEVREYSSDSGSAPEGLEPYPSGYNLITIKQHYDQWSKEDQEAFVAFLDAPMILTMFDEMLDSVKKSQQHLLANPGSTAGLFATWWKEGVHPLQEPRDADDVR
jgi:hypothetical protein